MKIKKDYHALTATEDVLKIIRECFVEEKKGNKEARNNTKDLLMEYFVKTADGSYTLNSNTIDGKSETMHTHHGAIIESMEKYIKPSKLKGKKEIRVLDICSGLGYNAASCIEYLDDDVKIEIDMIEISKETLAAALFVENPLKSYEIIKKAIEDKLYEENIIDFKFQNEIPDRININIYLDDARDVVKQFGENKKYDAIFLDPFSPAKSPELYTLEFLHILKDLLKNDGIILTYTSAAPVRFAMIHSGLHVGEGPQFGRRGGTLASKNLENIEKSLSENDERMIALSDSGIPFRDPKLNASGFEITKMREDERKSARGVQKFASTVRTPIHLCKDIEERRLKTRVLKNINAFGIDDLNSKKARFLVCPQFDECICGCGNPKLDNSYSRITEMINRLSKIVDKNNVEIYKTY
jgi:tRNA U34 5-methylaminomethyl-2-thiouridine-forming methyltransferase MnmC